MDKRIKPFNEQSNFEKLKQILPCAGTDYTAHCVPVCYETEYPDSWVCPHCRRSGTVNSLRNSIKKYGFKIEFRIMFAEEEKTEEQKPERRQFTEEELKIHSKSWGGGLVMTTPDDILEP